ncbi:hypothetical protein TNCV_723911 [Trichonephila clavipes]|nr:hypothetical protein TNCV_723911 [Trichonephila clavipes]
MACDVEDCGFQMLNDNEMVTSVQEESDSVDDETDEDEDNTTATKVARPVMASGGYDYEMLAVVSRVRVLVSIKTYRAEATAARLMSSSKYFC